MRTAGGLPYPRYWMTRLYLATNVLLITLATIFDAGTLSHRVVKESGTSGMLAVTALASIALVALMDCIINDLLTRRFVLMWAFRHRHLIYMALSIGLVSICYVTARHYGLSTIHGFYLLHAGFAAFVAFFDLFARHGQ